MDKTTSNSSQQNQATKTKASTVTTKKPKSQKPQPKKISRQTKTKIWFTIFCLAWTLFATFAGQFIVIWPMYWLLGDKLLQQAGWTLIYYILTYALTLTLILVVPVAVVRFVRKEKAKFYLRIGPQALDQLEKELATNQDEMGVNKLPTFIDIGLAPIGYIAYLLLAIAFTQIMSLFPWFQVDQSQNVGFSYFVTSLDRIFAVLAIVIIAPVAEELIMRGWLYGKLRNRWNIVISMLLTSLLFGAVHGQWNVGVSVFAMSLVLCGLREITGTIWSGMLLHILSNGIAFYLLYIAI